MTLAQDAEGHAPACERVHVPSPLYPAGWQPTEPDHVWISAPTTFARAAVAWAAAAVAVAHPLYPPEFAALVRQHWTPLATPHCVAIARPEVWRHRTQYGLCWHSSVQTILACTRAGWVVRIIGGHGCRRAAAEHELVAA